MSRTKLTEDDIVALVRTELDHQRSLGRTHDHHPMVWMNILLEEVGECAKEANELHFNTDGLLSVIKARENIVNELVQVAAVAIAAARSIANQ
jgi:NTP pyrophosphatase (non-canonical NTP hydrolase)